MVWRNCFLIVLVLALSACAGGPDNNGRQANLDRLVIPDRCKMSPLPAMTDEILPKAPFRDELRLSLSILHFTNAARCQNGLAPLIHDDGLSAVAQGHSQDMARLDFFDHVSSVRGKEGLLDRLRLQGISPQKANENIIQSYFLDYISNTTFITIDEDACLYAYGEGEPPLPRHTYAGMAESLVKRWLDSPGHRRNLLDPDVLYHGFGAADSSDPTLCGSLLGTQVMTRPFQ